MGLVAIPIKGNIAIPVESKVKGKVKVTGECAIPLKVQGKRKKRQRSRPDFARR